MTVAQLDGTLVVQTVQTALWAGFDNRATVVLAAQFVRQVSLQVVAQLDAPIAAQASMRNKKEWANAQVFRAQMASVPPAPRRAGSAPTA